MGKEVACSSMKTLYLDIFSGISGDMFLGAMIDLGVGLPQLERELAKLGVGGYHLHAERRQNAFICGVKFDVHLDGDPGHEDAPSHSHTHDHGHSHGDDPHHHHPHHHHHHQHQHHHEDAQGGHAHGHAHPQIEAARTFAGIRQSIQSSALSEWVKERAISVFHRVAMAEGKVHGQAVDQVHFHEVGAIDSIVDIVGACIALELLDRPRVIAAPVVEGTGWVDCAHGRFPVPTTATLEILGARGIAVTQCDEPHELVTPTGAALLAEFAETFEPMRGLVATRIGYGLGSRVNQTRPNVLRAVLGEVLQAGASGGLDWECDTVSVIETNLDDCSGEVLGHFVERALAARALDVFHTPIQMKKNRPGVLLTILCPVEEADRFSEMLLRETSAFGVRRFAVERRKLRRESVTVSTPYGRVAVKLGKLGGNVIRSAPEFESCKSVAGQAHVALTAVYEAALEAARPLLGRPGPIEPLPGESK